MDYAGSVIPKNYVEAKPRWTVASPWAYHRVTMATDAHVSVLQDAGAGYMDLDRLFVCAELGQAGRTGSGHDGSRTRALCKFHLPCGPDETCVCHRCLAYQTLVFGMPELRFTRRALLGLP